MIVSNFSKLIMEVYRHKSTPCRQIENDISSHEYVKTKNLWNNSGTKFTGKKHLYC
jgi:hypothetical protein